MEKPFAAQWNAKHERRTIEGMADSWIAKKSLEGPIGPLANGEDKPTPAPQSKLEGFAFKPFVIRPGRELLRRAWLYGHAYMRGYLTANIGASGIGKSSLAITEALAMAAARNLIGINVDEPLRVWYHCAEDSFEELERRFIAAIEHYGITAEDIEDRLFVTSGFDAKLKFAGMGRGSFAVPQQPTIDWVIGKIEEHRIDVAIFEPLVRLHGVEENDNTAMAFVASLFAEIANTTRCAVGIYHHVRKLQPGQSAAFEDARGAGALADAARIGRVINVMTEAEARNFSDELVKTRWRYFRVDDGKTSMSTRGVDADWYHLVSRSLENGEFGMDNDELVGVATRWEPDAPSEFGNGLLEAALANARQRGTMWREDFRSADWLGHAIAQTLGCDPKADKRKLEQVVNYWVRQGKLRKFKRYDAAQRKNFWFLQ